MGALERPEDSLAAESLPSLGSDGRAMSTDVHGSWKGLPWWRGKAGGGGRPAQRACLAPAEGAQGLAELVTSSGLNQHSQVTEPRGKGAWGTSDLCPRRKQDGGAKSSRGLSPAPKAGK